MLNIITTTWMMLKCELRVWRYTLREEASEEQERASPPVSDPHNEQWAAQLIDYRPPIEVLIVTATNVPARALIGWPRADGFSPALLNRPINALIGNLLYRVRVVVLDSIFLIACSIQWIVMTFAAPIIAPPRLYRRLLELITVAGTLSIPVAYISEYSPLAPLIYASRLAQMAAILAWLASLVLLFVAVLKKASVRLRRRSIAEC